MHMKLNFRRLLAMFLSIVMVAGMLPAAVFAEDGVETQSEPYVAYIGEQGYETLADAVAAVKANGGTLTLLADANESMTFNYPADGAPVEIILDLNGFTITSAESTLWVSDGYVVTVMDSSAAKTGKIVTTSTGDEAIAIARGGKVILNSGTVEGEDYGIYLYSDRATGGEALEMNGGTVTVPNGGTAIVIGSGKVTINAGKVLCNKSPNGGGWNTYVYEGGTLEITGGEFLGTIGNFGTTSISGGTFSYCDDPNDGFNNEHLAAGYITQANADGSITVIPMPELPAPPEGFVWVRTYQELVAALGKDNAKVIMANDITGTATQNSGYGKAGIVLGAGDVLDGNGKTLTINGANSKWDCAIAMTGGEVKNLTIAGAMRGVFMPGANGDVVIDNCVFKDVVYTFNSDAGSKDYTVTIKNTTLNGWTSFSDVHKSVTFENCSFGKGSDYAFCRPYQATTFTKCSFDEGFKLDTAIVDDNALEFTDCTYADAELSADNNAMFSGGGFVMIDGVSTDVTPPTGSNSYAYTTEVDGKVHVWGEGRGNAKESFVLKLYSGETLIATTKLNNVGGIINGDVYVTWHFFYPESTDDYWTTTWEEGHPNSAAQPTEVELYIDGTLVATTDAKMSGADGVNPVEWAELGGVKKIVTGLSGSGTEAEPFLINNLEELIWFRDTVDNVQPDRSNQFLGKYVKLTANIDLAGINWNPIGEKKDHGSFMGIFDGGDHTIFNLYVEQAGENLGLFAYTGSFSESEQAVIKNLTLHNVTVKSTNNSNYVGGLVGNATTTNFENIYVTGTVEISGGAYIGGIVGHGYSDFDNVSVKATNGTISSTIWCAGGVIGYLGEGSTIKNAVVEDLTIKSAAGGLGSIVGMAEDNNGTQPCTGEDLSAKNVEIKTYTGAYGDSYANYALGYLYGGNPTSKLTGTLTVENVTVETSTGVAPTIVDAVASIGDAIYFDLQDAVNAAQNGDEIKVLRSVTTDELTIPDGATVVLNLNGKTLNGYIAPCTPASLTISNGSIKNSDSSKSAIEINAGTLALTNVNIESARHAVRIDGAVTATIDGGEYTLNATSGTRHAINVSGAANVTIKAGTFVGPKETTMDSGSAVCVQAGAKATIEGGNFSGGKNATLAAAAGTLTVTGGTFDQDPSTYVATGYKAEENEGTFSVVKSNTIWKVATKAELADAVAKAQAGDTILLTADIDYGTDHVTDNDTASTWGITKAITLDLGGHTLTTHARNFGLALRNDGVIVTNGKLNHVGTVAAIKVWDAAEISDLEINVTGTSSSGNTIDGIVIQENAAGVDIIKNVKIYSASGQGVDSGIKTHNCGNATEPVIGSMEDVTIDAKSVGLNISAPCGTATNCSIKGGKNGIEIWIKGTYSATLGLVGCEVVGGVFAHDEFSSNPSIANNGTLRLTADGATTGASKDDITLTIARAEKVEGILKDVMDNAQAKVNDTYYATLQAAIDAAQNNDTITLLYAEGDAPIAMNGAVYGKTVTITGTATVDWSKDFLFVGRGGEGHGTVIFDNAKLTSASNSSSYGIHVSGREKDTDNKYDGTLIIKNSTIELDYLINKGTMTLDNSTLTVKNGFSVGGRPASETESGEDATATLNLTNGSKVIVNNHNGMGLGYEAIGVMNVNTGSTFECTQSFLVTGKGTMNVNGGNVKIDGTLTNNGTVAVTGETTLNINTLTGSTIDLMEGAIVKNSTVGGKATVLGTTIFRGENTFTMIDDYGPAYSPEGQTANWMVENGASLTLTEKARYGLGYGDKVVINGNLTDALTARETLTDDKIVVSMHGLVAMSSWNVENSFEVNNAYVVIGSNNSFGNKPGNYGGTYKFAFDNVVLDSSRITFYEAGSTTEFTFNNSDVNVGTFMIRDADSVFTLTDTKLVSTTTSNGNDEGNYLAGTLVLNNSSLRYAAPLEMENGTLTLGAGSRLIAPSITGTGKIIIDATGMTAGKVAAITANASSFAGTIKVINNDKLTAVIDGNGDIVLVEVKTYVAQIGEEKFETVAAALAYAKEQGMTDVEITLIGETESNTTDSFDLLYTTLFNSVTFKQEDPTKTYYLYELYTGVRTNGGKFIFDGVNITVTDQYMFQGNVELINNSKITSKAEANCFFYYANVIVNGGSSIKGVIEDIRGGTLTIDGGKTDGTYAETPGLQDAILAVNWADSKLVLQNGAYVKINAANEVGRLTVNGTLNISDSKLDSYQWIAVNAGATLTVNGNSTITTKEITGTGKIIIDATGMTAGKVEAISANASGFTGTIEVINNDKLTAAIDDNGNIVLVAKVVEATIKAESATLLYEDMIQIRYKFSVVGEDIAEYGMLLFSSETDAGAHDVTKAIQQKALIKESDGFYYGYTDGIAAKEMGDSQFVVGYVKLNDGSYVYGNPVEYSPKIYAQRMVNKDTSSAETKALCNALMNYGAAAQLYFEYKTDFLMNDGFASVNYDGTVLGTSIFSVNTTVTNGFTTKSATLLFEGALTYRVKYAASNEISDKSLYLEYTVKGATNSVQMKLETDGYYYGYIAGIAAKDMDEALNAKPYYLDDTGNRVYGAGLVYSGYEYARRTIANSSDANSVNLAKAFAMYISAANAAISK